MDRPPVTDAEPGRKPRGCCGCLFLPAVVTLFGGSVFWLFGFTVGVVFHALASIAWATTYAIGHAVFSWPLPDLKSREHPPMRLRD